MEIVFVLMIGSILLGAALYGLVALIEMLMGE
jgi:hypothetical protein